MTTPSPTNAMQSMLWDIFCRVVDNFGDIGVCWRLAVNLASHGQQVRLWVDDASPLSWMAPGALDGRFPGIEIRSWQESQQIGLSSPPPPLADIWIEAFGCEITPEFVAFYADFLKASGDISRKIPVWVNLEYLTAEDYAERCHTLPSPVMSGAAKGWTKYFFYPGFTHRTGGLLREADLWLRQTRFNKVDWLAKHRISWHGERLISLFCYTPSALSELIRQLDNDDQPTQLLVTAGRASAAVQEVVNSGQTPPQDTHGKLKITYLPHLSQLDFDHLLWACDFNCIRGEDSLVRALWAGKPFVWQIYPQHDDAHHDKLCVFLDMLGANESLRHLHRAWNGLPQLGEKEALPRLELDAWQEITEAARTRLARDEDLVTKLLTFVLKNR